MIKTIAIIVGIVFVILVCVFVLSACVLAGRSERQMEQLNREKADRS